jgi:glycine/D-amino acid oxidase-like deaminating enzyme
MSEVAIDVDVLVVGGGVQGLSVLLELQRRGVASAFLLSRDPLGEGETLHSHGYLRRGYDLPVDTPLPLARGFADAFEWWARFLARKGLRYAEGSPTYLGTADPSVAARWHELGLPFEPLSRPPEPLAAGHYARGGHLFRTEERLFLGTDVVRALEDEVAGGFARGEVIRVTLDRGRKRIERCEAMVGDRIVPFRPSFVVLAAGRDAQRLLRGVAAGAPGNGETLADRMDEPHLVREVPMILARGKDLPNVSGFFLDAKLFIAAHPAGEGARMWVATPLGGHATTRGDVDGRREPAVDPSLVSTGLDRLRAVVPGALEGRGVGIGAYSGAKIDHPSGAPAPVVADLGVANLQVAWPVVLTLARPAAVEVVARLERAAGWEELARARRPLPERARSLAAEQSGVGSERRLAPTQRWCPPGDPRELAGP